MNRYEQRSLRPPGSGSILFGNHSSSSWKRLSKQLSTKRIGSRMKKLVMLRGQGWRNIFMCGKWKPHCVRRELGVMKRGAS